VADEVLYLYAITDSDLEAASLTGMRAVDDAPVYGITEGALSAVVSPVDEERFSAASLRRNLEDLRWLEAVARAHDGVVSELARSRPVAPVRLATVFLDEDRLRTLLRARTDEFTAALDRIRGRVEWAVKAFTTPAAPAAQPAEVASSATPGRAFLERKRAERDDAEHRRHRAVAQAESVHARLAEIALATRRYPPQDRRLSGYRDEMLLNAAYLVSEGGEDALRQVTQEPVWPELRLELTGPWAPYSFATLEER
jgi:gas vesicle protein GvpL/GvpF